jgi:hypothetical protein
MCPSVDKGAYIHEIQSRAGLFPTCSWMSSENEISPLSRPWKQRPKYCRRYFYRLLPSTKITYANLPSWLKEYKENRFTYIGNSVFESRLPHLGKFLTGYENLLLFREFQDSLSKVFGGYDHPSSDLGWDIVSREVGAPLAQALL